MIACASASKPESSEHAVSRIPVLFIVAITYRLRYYFAWAVSESSLIFSGLCYNGVNPDTDRPRWDRCENARIAKVGSLHCRCQSLYVSAGSARA